VADPDVHRLDRHHYSRVEQLETLGRRTGGNEQTMLSLVALDAAVASSDAGLIVSRIAIFKHSAVGGAAEIRNRFFITGRFGWFQPDCADT
jgi:hypothetical protein